MHYMVNIYSFLIFYNIISYFYKTFFAYLYLGTVRVKASNPEDMSLIDGDTQSDDDNDIQKILNQIEENEHMMEDTPDGEALRMYNNNILI